MLPQTKDLQYFMKLIIEPLTRIDVVKDVAYKLEAEAV